MVTAGCAQVAAPGDAPRVGTATPLIGLTPTVTYADPAQRAALVANEAYFAGETATAIAESDLATRVAFDRAQAEATKSALSLTQQVEMFNQQSTQQAVSVAATATAGVMALGATAQAQTATVQGLEARSLEATARAEDLDAQRQARVETDRVREQAALDWQTGYVIKLALSVLAVIAGAVLIYHLARLLAFAIPIFIRRLLVLTRDRLVFDPATERWMLLPDYPALPAPAPEPVPDRLRSVVQRAVDQGRAVPDDLAQQRARRIAWRNAAWAFLRWGAYLDGFSQPRMAAAGVSDTAWRAMVEFLASLGLLVKDGAHRTAPWALPLDGDGERMTVRGVLQSALWLTSFQTPDAPPPSIPRPPAARYATPNPNEPNERTRRPEPPEVEDVAEGEGLTPVRAYASRLATEFPPELHIEPAPGE